MNNLSYELLSQNRIGESIIESTYKVYGYGLIKVSSFFNNDKPFADALYPAILSKFKKL